jgi:hypothetical protein
MPDQRPSLAGVIRDPIGEPVRHAWVVFGYFYGCLETRTDDAGRFHLHDLETDRGQLTVSADGHEPAVVTVEFPEHGAGRQDVVLPFGGKEFAGRVLDEDGAPLAGIAVRWYPRAHSDLPEGFRTTETDGQGRFRLGGIPTGRHSVQAFDPFRTFVNSQDADAGATDLEFRLRPAGVIAGRVDLPDPPALKPGATLGAVVLRPLGSPGRERSHELRVADFRLEHLEPGEYDVQARISGIGTSSVERLTVRAGEETRVSLAPSPGAGLSGRVITAEDGRPVDGARVVAIEVTMPVNALLSSEPERMQGAGGTTTLSGEDGSFQLHGLTNARHRVAVHRAGRIPSLLEGNPGPEIDPLRFSLHAAGSLRIEVSAADEGLFVVLRYPNGASRLELGRDESQVLFDDLPTGVYEISIDGEDVGYRALPLVREGETTSLSLAPPEASRRFTGRFAFPEGVPRSYFVFAWWEKGGVTWIRCGRLRKDGAFEITGLPDDAFEVAPFFGGSPVSPQLRKLRPGMPVTPGDPAVTLPVEAVELRLVNAVTGDPVFPPKADTNRVVLPLFPPGADEVTYTLPRYHPVRILSPSTVKPNEVELHPAKKAWIRAVDGEDRHLHGAGVKIEDADGWDLTELAKWPGQLPPFEEPPSFRLAPGDYKVTITHPDHAPIAAPLTMTERSFSGCIRLGS